MKRPFAATVPAVAALGVVFEAHKIHPLSFGFSRQHQPVVLHPLSQSPRITMFDYKCVPEPLSIVLNMLVYPFLSPKGQGTERVQRPDVVDENVGRDWFLLW